VYEVGSRFRFGGNLTPLGDGLRDLPDRILDMDEGNPVAGEDVPWVDDFLAPRPTSPSGIGATESIFPLPEYPDGPRLP
jgi:hypothetical protein